MSNKDVHRCPGRYIVRDLYQPILTNLIVCGDSKASASAPSLAEAIFDRLVRIAYRFTRSGESMRRR